MPNSEFSNDVISRALRYCISDVGDYCNLCAYQQLGPGCSKELLRDASDRIKELSEKKED